jgi:hypothetical protein
VYPHFTGKYAVHQRKSSILIECLGLVQLQGKEIQTGEMTVRGISLLNYLERIQER